MNVIEMLELSKEKNEIVEIYTDPNKTSVFSCGIVSAIFDNEVIINHFTPEGRYDGYVVKSISDIYKVVSGNKYTDKIRRLSIYHKVKHANIEIINDNGFVSVLHYAYDNDRIVDIELFDSDADDIVGFVTSIDEESCTFSLVDEYGVSEGISVVYINDISFICCDGDRENLRTMLYYINNSKIEIELK